MTNHLNAILFSCCVLSLFTSCSVMMAARRDGTSIEQVQACRSRADMVSYGATVISSERLEWELVEVYQFQKERGSASRAFMHGVLDISTFGLWEALGTPLEVCTNDKKFFTLKVYYDDSEAIKKIELLS